MTQQKRAEHNDAPQQPQTGDEQRSVPKPESSSEYEGAENREPTGNPGSEVKTETSSSSGQ